MPTQIEEPIRRPPRCTHDGFTSAKFRNGIQLEQLDGGLLVRQYRQAYFARNWRLSHNTLELVRTAVQSHLWWMIRNRHPQANARWPHGKGVVYLAFSPQRDDHWSLAIDTVSPSGDDFGHAVFNGKYRRQFEEHRVSFEFEKRNTRAGHMVVARDDVLKTIRLVANLDHSVLSNSAQQAVVDGFLTESDIQHALLGEWGETPFASFQSPRQEVPLGDRRNARRIDILAEHPITDEVLIVELKRAQASKDAVDQVLGYSRELGNQPDFVGRTLCRVFVAERVSDEVKDYARKHGVRAYEVSWPLALNRVA